MTEPEPHDDAPPVLTVPSPPSPQERFQQLIADRDRDALTLHLIDTALTRGITWANIARTLRVRDKAAAKKRHRDLQRTIRERTLTIR